MQLPHDGMVVISCSHHRPQASSQPSLSHVATAAGVAGVALSVVLSPVELIKCRLQLGSYDKQFHRHKGPLDVLRSVVAEEGVRGLSRGMGATMAREVPGNAIYFVAYHGLRRWVDAAMCMEEQHGVVRNMYEATAAVTCGGAAGVVMWYVWVVCKAMCSNRYSPHLCATRSLVFPVDAAKTCIQTTRPGSVDDVGLVRQLRGMWGRGGVRVMYGGLAPTLLRAFPANACQWLAWEATMGLLPT